MNRLHRVLIILYFVKAVSCLNITIMSRLDETRDRRIQKLNELKKNGINPYPAKIKKSHKVSQALEMKGQSVEIAGRIRSIRGHGNLFFIDLQDPSARMQIMIRKGSSSDASLSLAQKLDVGDFIAVQGTVMTTKTGQLTVESSDLQLASKSLRPLPDTWYGLKDVEERYRHRYLDMIINDDVKEKIITRSKVIQAMRQFLLNEGFLEVETPILETNASGALANPFLTHIKAYDLDLYLRICIGELWQKKLMIAGIEKTFEIGRAFRNEGVDREHNPEFTMIEYYWGYADYQMNMAMQERLLEYIVRESTGSTKVKVADQEIEFKAPYPRKKFRDIIMEYTELDIDGFNSLKDLQQAMKDYGFKLDPKWGVGRLTDEFYKEYVRPNIIQPVFLTHHPKDLKPLAKEDPDYPGYTQSFQLLTNGFEVSNNYSELNDPIDQNERFKTQQALDDAGDDETMSSDEEFVEALEYGMPPTSGTGIGIDRLVALLTNSHHIREIIAFPLMKPRIEEKQQHKSKKQSISNSKLTDSIKPTADITTLDENAKRFVVVVNGKVEPGRLMNAIGHMTAGLVGNYSNQQEFAFVDYTDKEGNLHAKLSHYPFIILKAKNSNQILSLREKLIERKISFYDFTDSMPIGTTHEQVSATKQKSAKEQTYFGLTAFADTDEIKELTKKFSLYK